LRGSKASCMYASMARRSASARPGEGSDFMASNVDVVSRIADAPLRKPMTDMAGCCARATRGPVAAPQSKVMKSRTPNWPHTLQSAI